MAPACPRVGCPSRRRPRDMVEVCPSVVGMEIENVRSIPCSGSNEDDWGPGKTPPSARALRAGGSIVSVEGMEIEKVCSIPCSRSIEAMWRPDKTQPPARARRAGGSVVLISQGEGFRDAVCFGMINVIALVYNV